MSKGASSLLLPRVLGALALRPSVYAEIAGDRGAGLQCAIVVLLTAVFEGASSAALHHEAVMDARQITPYLVAAPLGWLIWSGIVWGVGVRAFGYRAEFAAVMRAIGLAHAPGLILAIALVPGLTILTGSLYLLSLAWFVAALVAAASGSLAVPLRPALLVIAVSLAAHETLRQGLRLVGLQA